ncbi:MAG TPA: GNAT family N-acetyltransferase [Xanthobacteraceae bacterium]|nr:GNAT family N-acetyltransferase [Xanthobacteraceae bacterium]
MMQTAIFPRMRADGEREWTGRLPAALSSRGIARLELIAEIAAAEPHWRKLEVSGVLTPYQRFDWIAGWQRHVGAAEGISPHLIAAFDIAGEPLFLLPLGASASGRFTVLRFLGGKHANYNFGPWRRDFACDAAALRALIDWLAELRPGLDAIELLNQPESWDGMQNPFRSLPHQGSPSDGFRLALTGAPEELFERILSNSMRGRLRTKERKLEKLAGYRYLRARTPAEVERFLDAFFAQKSARLAEQGIDNVFAAPGVADFIREACLQGLEQEKPVIEIHALDTDSDVLAIFAGVNDDKRFSSMFNSYTLGDAARQSPGLLLLVHVIRDHMQRGLSIYDHGVGEAQYKSMFSDAAEPLFDSYFGLSPRGQALAAIAAGKAMIKRWVKRSPKALELALTLRRMLAGGKKSGGDAAA